MKNGLTNDESSAIGSFIENLDKINCIHEWYETENYYIKCKKCNQLQEDMADKKYT